MADGIGLQATAHVKLTKRDENGNIIDVIERDVELTEEEAREIWRLQQQA